MVSTRQSGQDSRLHSKQVVIVTQEVSRTWGRSRVCTYTPQGFLILDRDRSRRQPLCPQRWTVGGHPDLPAGGHQEDTIAITERDRIR
jgi:hypothetical protein